MPICIECRYPVPQLYHVLHSSSHKPSYAAPKSASNLKSPSTPSSFPTPNVTTPKSKAGGESKSSGAGGGDVRLTQCPRCKRFADKYVEHDFVVLFIDLVLVKPQVKRHAHTETSYWSQQRAEIVPVDSGAGKPDSLRPDIISYRLTLRVSRSTDISSSTASAATTTNLM